MNTQKESWKINGPTIISSFLWISPRGSTIAKLKCKTEIGESIDMGQTHSSPWAEENGSGWVNGSYPAKQCRVNQTETAEAWRQNHSCPCCVTQTSPMACFFIHHLRVTIQTYLGEFFSEMTNKNEYKTLCRASLVAQWLRVRLPMQGTRVRAPVRDDPTCRAAAGPVSHGR